MTVTGSPSRCSRVASTSAWTVRSAGCRCHPAQARPAAPAPRAAGFLMGMRVQGETGVEVAGAARALRAVMRKVQVDRGRVAIDTAGTRGGRVGTFNVSTAAAFVAAAAGATVAKHGNRSYTSRCGSADVLEALGIDLGAQAAAAERIVRDVGMVFLFAPAFHPAMRF